MIKYTNFFVHNIIRKNLKHSLIMRFLIEHGLKISPNISKVNLEKILRKILFNDQVIDSLCTKYKKELALEPINLEILLGCSRSERLRWTKENKLPIVYFKDVYKFGAHLMCPMYDRRIIGLKITDDILNKWRAEWAIRRRKKHKIGQKIVIKRNSIFQDASRIFLDIYCDQWYSINTELGIIFELSYWLSILKYHINNRIERSKTSRAHYYEHKYSENIFYGYLISGLKILIQSQYTQVYLYKTKQDNRYSVTFCNKHKDYVFNNDLGFIHPLEDFYIHPEIYKQCKDCKVQIRENYYSIYYIEVKCKECMNYIFTFYIKAYLGKEIFLTDDIPIINKKSKEGMLICGKENIYHDIYIPTENYTLQQLKQIIVVAKEFFNKKKKLN